MRLNGRILGLSSALGVLALLSFGQPAHSQKSAPKSKITAEQANAIAVKKFHGKVEGKTPLENEEGKWQYGVMVRTGKTLREVMVNAQTGKIDSVEVTTDAKEAAEKKAEAAEAKTKVGKAKSKKDEKDDTGANEDGPKAPAKKHVN